MVGSPTEAVIIRITPDVSEKQKTFNWRIYNLIL